MNLTPFNANAARGRFQPVEGYLQQIFDAIQKECDRRQSLSFTVVLNQRQFDEVADRLRAEGYGVEADHSKTRIIVSWKLPWTSLHNTEPPDDPPGSLEPVQVLDELVRATLKYHTTVFEFLDELRCRRIITQLPEKVSLALSRLRFILAFKQAEKSGKFVCSMDADEARAVMTDPSHPLYQDFFRPDSARHQAVAAAVRAALEPPAPPQ